MTQADPMHEKFEEVEFFGKPALFTNIRIDRSMLPPGLYHYDIQHFDKGGMIPSVVKENVRAHYFGSIVLNEPLKLMESKYSDYKLMEYEDLNFKSKASTIPEYQKTCPTKHPEHKYPSLVEKPAIPEHDSWDRVLER